jgi:hypothetical protein
VKVFVIYDDFNFVTVGVVRADTEESAIGLAEWAFNTPFSHRYIATEFELVEPSAERGEK